MEIHAHLMLADHVARADGKLYISGGGWSHRAPNPVPWALAIDVTVPWSDNNRSFRFRLELLDADGNAYEAETPEGMKPVGTDGEIKVTAGPHLKPGMQLKALVAVGLPMIPLPAGGQYEWKLSINDKTRDEWRVGFSVLGRAQRAA